MIIIAENIRAHELAKEQRAISISEFFTKNRHLLGFDSPVRALLTAVKELVDNSLDACEEMKVLPEIKVQIAPLDGREDRFTIIVEDNGPGIVKQQIPNVFAKLLYGSKFFKLRQLRGQQGIGVSAAVLYSQLTTGKSAKIISKIDPRKPAHYFELHIDTSKNEPEILKEEEAEWNKDHGTRVELELEAKYQKGSKSVEEYLKECALINPSLKLVYIDPEGQEQVFQRATSELPKESIAIKPHPYGVELGMLQKMLKETSARTLQSFLTNDFSRVGGKTAKEICDKAKINTNSKPKRITREEVENLIRAIKQTRLIAPPTNCLSPIGAELLEKGLKKEVNAEFFIAITRPPSVYRGMPFQVECAIAYGGDLDKETPVDIMRFANKVPLLYQQGACAITRSIQQTRWRGYGLQQSGSNVPVGPAIIAVHIASVWVPFTSESKEALAHYPEIIKEIKLALQECGRKLGAYFRRTIKTREQKEKANLFEKYIPELAGSISKLSDEGKKEIEEELRKMLKKNLPLILSGEGIGELKKENDEKTRAVKSIRGERREERQMKLNESEKKQGKAFFGK